MKKYRGARTSIPFNFLNSLVEKKDRDMPKKHIDEITILPDFYFKDRKNYAELWSALIKRFPQSSRSLPDALTMITSNIYAAGIRFRPHILHWHQIAGDDDGRSLRNFLRSDISDGPKCQSRNMDLLRYTDLCLQYTDLDYRKYVVSWCLEQIFDEENDLQ